MPNRVIKESICTSENVDQLSAFQETVFYRLIVNCDDYGRMDARPKILSSRLFPLKDIRAGQIEEALRALSSAELVIIYEVDGKPFLQMRTWDRHQQVRAKRSKYPSPESGRIADEIGCGNLIANDSRFQQTEADASICEQMVADGSICPRNPIQSESESNPNPKRMRTRARTSTPDEFFDAFWKEYPKKTAKPKAINAWNKLKPDQELIPQIMAGLQKWKNSDQWTRDDGMYIPNPATWINDRRWEDDIPQRRSAQPRPTVAQAYIQRDYDELEETPEEMLARLQAEM